MNLVENIKKAITDVDIEKLYNYKAICDRLHNSIPVKDYSIEDLPSDELYEDMINVLHKGESIAMRLDKEKYSGRRNAAFVRKDTGYVSLEGTKFVKGSTISDLWMGSIPKIKKYEPINDVMFMPKFDGVSCGLRLKRNNTNEFELDSAITRGIEVGYTRKSTDLKDKMLKILTEFIININNSEFQFESCNMKDVKQINLRGEIVLKDKSSSTSAPAAIVSGKVNGGEQVWNYYCENIEYIPVEIIRIIDKDDKISRPTQEFCIKFFRTLGFYSYSDTDLMSNVSSSTSDTSSNIDLSLAPSSNVSSSTSDTSSASTSDTSSNIDLSLAPSSNVSSSTSDTSSVNINEIFNYFTTLIQNPLDGVVYCSKLWQYPQCKAETNASVYGKFAWKPTSKTETILKEIEYNIARDGKINLELIYDPVNINGKNYSRAKTSIRQLLILDGIGIGSTITVKLMGDISPMIVEFEPNDEIKSYKLIDKCPWCKSTLKLETKKDQSTLKCLNLNCREIIKQKMKNFLTVIGVKGVAEKRLESLKEITLQEIENKYVKTLKDIIKQVNTKTFLVALGFGGVTQVNKLLKSTDLEYRDVLPITKNYDELIKLINKHRSPTDEFTTNIMKYYKDLL